jgi:hypothetical protein
VSEHEYRTWSKIVQGISMLKNMIKAYIGVIIETISFFSNRSARPANTNEPRTHPQIKFPSFSIIAIE